ncbi:MAG: hypothetical protein QOE70_6773 [Chthoniobacter sp.]|jgi:Raf kinase inhibitor-like YbhB/YbcL family protein|nr:hypothetical protein [Chthoniobacter sp.]
MNTSRITTTVAALVFALVTPVQAQKKGDKSNGEKAADTAAKILGGLLGDKTQPAGKGAKGGQLAPLMDAEILAQQAQMFGGAYRADNGDRVVIRPAGAGCFVQMTSAKGAFTGVGFSVDGFFAASFDPGKQGGVIVYRIEEGKLNGTGVTYAGDSVGVIAENLEGPKKLGGTYRIASAATPNGGSYTGSCAIKLVADNSYELTWTVGDDKFSGVGFEMGPNLWVSWSPKKDAFLTVFERSQDDRTTLARHALFNTGKPPSDLAPVKLQPAGAPVAKAGAPIGLEQPIDAPAAAGPMTLASTSFAAGGALPRRLASAPEGQNISPSLLWTGTPPQTRELAIVCYDPDAPGGNWVHWVVYGIPPNVTQVQEGQAPQGTPGSNSWGKRGWGGPLPPAGDPAHRYIFTVYALDRPLKLPAGLDGTKVLAATKGKVAASARLQGTYQLGGGGVAAAPPAGRNRPAPGAAPQRDQFGNIILQGPPPVGLERPIDMPANAVGQPLVGVAGQPGFAPAAAPGPVLAPGQTAADLAEKKSQDQGGGEVALTVTNATAGAIRVNWLDQDGKEGKSDDTIAAGARVEIGTTGAGHFFRARDARTNALLQEFRVKNQGGKFEITITGGPGNGAAPAPARRKGAAVAPPAAAVAAAPAAPANPQAVAEFLKVHNDARAEVGVPPLQWDPKLAAYAQEWASNLAARDAFDHRPDGSYGENIAGFLPGQGEGPASGARRWYGEKSNYRPGSKVGDPQKGEVTHYTQMVWRKTTRVGFGIAVNSQGMAILVANYDPPGNFPEKPY